MLIVKIENGDKAPMELVVNDLNDVATVQQSILREYQEVQKQDFKFDEERLLDNTPFSDLSELEDWIDEFEHWNDLDQIDEALEIKAQLECSDYDDIDRMTSRIEDLEDAMSEIYYTASNVRH